MELTKAEMFANWLETAGADFDCNAIAAELRRLSVIESERDALRAEVECLRAAPAPVALTPAQQHADELLAALRGMLALGAEHHQRGHDDDDVCQEVREALDVIAAIEATGQEGGAA